MIEQIKLLEKEIYDHKKAIHNLEEQIFLLRSKCNHNYQVSYDFLDGDREYTCTICGDTYVH